MHQPVVIVGAGPVGLSTALALATHGIRSIVVEREPRTSEHSRAPGIHVRTVEAFRRWGVAERFLAEGTLLRHVRMHTVEGDRGPLLTMDFSALDNEADRPGLLVLPQSRTEQLLLDAVRATGMCDVRFATEAVDLTLTTGGTRLTVQCGGRTERIDAPFVIGCDGAGSFVRSAVGLPFDGRTYALRPMLADIEVADRRDDLPWPRVWTAPSGFAFAVQLRPGLWRLIHVRRGDPRGEDVPDAEVAELARHLLGPGDAPVVWASRFRIHARSAPRIRIGRVLLAGDAAHVHSPISGFGMNGGIQDANDLGWKLARSLNGGDAERLLDAYDIERRAVVVEDTSRFTDVLTRLFFQSPAAFRNVLFTMLRALLRVPAFERRMLRRLAMFDLRCAESPLLRADWPAAGERLPNVLLQAPDGGSVRLHDLLLNAPTLLEIAGSTPRVKPVDVVQHVLHIGARGYQDPEGILHGMLEGRDGHILVRPDGCIAWALPNGADLVAATRHALGEPPA